jgi:hypothetical protein
MRGMNRREAIGILGAAAACPKKSAIRTPRGRAMR